MTMLPDVDIGSGGVRFAKDYVGADYHNEGHSHIDALQPRRLRRPPLRRPARHLGRPRRAPPPGRSTLLEDGLVGRGVLLDVPRLRGVPWLEPGEHVFPDDLEAAERAQGVRGRRRATSCWSAPATPRRLAELAPWDTAKAKAGLHPPRRVSSPSGRVAALGSDGNNDTAPSTTEGIAFPIHVLALNAMGIHLLDYLQFEDLVRRLRGGAGAGSSSSSPRRCGSSGAAPLPPGRRVGAAGRWRPSERPRVLVLGGGFAGVGAAKELEDADADVVLVDRHDYHTFQPLLYQLATGLLEHDRRRSLAARPAAATRRTRRSTRRP